MLERIVSDAPVFFLVAVRCFAMIMTLPLLSAKTVPRAAKIALAGYLAYYIFPQISGFKGVYGQYGSYISPTGNFNLDYIFLVLGEGLIGMIIGFFIQMVFSAFSTAGQFFAFQMGLSASEVYDSLSQVENPLMGQFFNFLAMLVFLQSKWFQLIFVNGLFESFKVMNVFSIVANTEFFAKFMLSGLSELFKIALVVALPLMGSLFLINVTVGILSKAAPQMNLLSEGFPVLLLTSFVLIWILIPSFNEFFNKCFTDAFRLLYVVFLKFSKGGAL